MVKRSALTVALASVMVLCAAAQAPSVAEMNTRLRAEETDHSQMMWIMHEISDVHGPRLTGSPGLRAAQDWVVAAMKAWGLSNVKLEPWNFNHQGWQNDELEANVLQPFQQPLNVRAVSWTPGTKGTIEGPVLVVLPPLLVGGGRFVGATGGRSTGAGLAAIAQAGTSPAPMPPPPVTSTEAVTQADLDAYLASIKATVRGAIVFFGPHVDVPEDFVPAPLRRADDFWDNFRVGVPVAPGAGPAAVQVSGLTRPQIATQVLKFLADNGASVVVNDAGRAYGVIVQQSTAGYDEDPGGPHLPRLLMGNEDYGRIFRAVTEDHLTVTVRLNIHNTFFPEGKTAYNVTAELPGTDKADEVVMLGGHFDSWNGGTGAFDDGAGATDALEAMRLLKAIGVRTRRTIRVALWSGEEQGMLGSIAYVAQHFGSAEHPKPEFFTFDGYLNIDGGTGKPRAASVFGPPEAAQMLRDPMSLFRDWGFHDVTPTLTRSLAGASGSDHMPFNNAGLPGIDYAADPFDHDTFSHHTNLDTYERIYEPDLRESAVEEALTAYALANAGRMLPRCSAATMPPSSPAGQTALPPPATCTAAAASDAGAMKRPGGTRY